MQMHKTSTLQSAYMVHTLSQHEYAAYSCMSCLENFYIQLYQHKALLIDKHCWRF